jgi:hypothetical protein
MDLLTVHKMLWNSYKGIENTIIVAIFAKNNLPLNDQATYIV